MTTEKSEDWNPGHSLNKGYPYAEIVSREIMPQRLALDMFMNDKDDPRVFLREEPNIKDFPTYPGFPEKQTKLEQFLLDRAYDYHMALEAAEGQINVLLDEKPFIPEQLGFYTAIKNEVVTEVPVHIYVSKYNENVALYRKPLEDPNDFRGSTLTTWVLTKRQNGVLLNIDVNLPCERIAYATLWALGVQMDGEVVSEPAESKKKSTGKGFYDVTFVRPTQDPKTPMEIDMPGIPAKDGEEALTKANFILQTEYGIVDAKREELGLATSF